MPTSKLGNCFDYFVGWDLHKAIETTPIFTMLGWIYEPRVSHGDQEVHADLMGDIVFKQLKMNSVEEFRAALRGEIPRRYLDPDAPWDGQPLD